MEKIPIYEAINLFENMKSIEEENIINIINLIDFFQQECQKENVNSFIEYMRIDNNYDQAVINFVRSLFPKAHYGINYNPIIQPDKNGREKCAQGWVRISSPKKFNSIEWSISHKYTAIALLIALLHVLHDYNKVMDNSLSIKTL